jgi:probable rRNA maturation factor
MNGRIGNPSYEIAMDVEIEINDTQNHMRIDAGSLRDLAARVLDLQGQKRASISIALVDNDTIQRINRAHLGHDWPTDVITFPLSEPAESVLAGELVISAEMACAAAGERGLDPAAELALYVVHGLLHLCGYDDREEAAALLMQKREQEVLAAGGLPGRLD